MPLPLTHNIRKVRVDRVREIARSQVAATHHTRAGGLPMIGGRLLGCLGVRYVSHDSSLFNALAQVSVASPRICKSETVVAVPAFKVLGRIF